MIIDVSGKRVVFEMVWQTRLSEGDVHRDARNAKSRFLWHADKAFYYGVLNENDRKEKPKAPLYAGAIALMHRFPDVPNLVLVLEVPTAGYIVCAIHQGRPKSGMDVILEKQVDVSNALTEFKTLCGAQGFKLCGDIQLPGMDRVTMEDIVESLDHTVQLRRVKSALINPLAFIAAGTAVAFAGTYAYHAYTQYRNAEAQRKAMAAQKNSQQLYQEELVARRADAAIRASDVMDVIRPIRAQPLSRGGWPLQKVTCDIPPAKKIVCTFEFSRGEKGSGTYKTFDAAAKDFDAVEFNGDVAKATKAYTSLPFIEQGKALDATKTQREETIEFGSKLQRLANLGKGKMDEHRPFAIPAAANPAELTSLPVGAAKWEFSGPVRALKAFADSPDYATVSQVIVTLSGKPAYEADQSIAMTTVTGKIFSKPN